MFGSVHFEAGADAVVKLLSERTEDTLGIGLEIVKENDIGRTPKQILAYEFDKFGLCGVREAAKGEFVDVETGKQTLAAQVVDYLLEHGKASATGVAKALRVNRGDVSALFNLDRRFVNLGKQGKEVLYGVKTGPEGPTG